jgi:SAM-dependent methyltransferase
MRVLHVGCGRKKWTAEELFRYVGLKMQTEGVEVLHLDADSSLKPDIVCCLGTTPIPLPDNSIDLVVAWHVLEHIGKQGDIYEWFYAFEELYRVLQPDGWLYGESPYYTSLWAWSDPTHSRVISEHSFIFFAQSSYTIDSSAISPYRINCDFGWLGMTNLEKGFRVIQDKQDPRIHSIRFCLIAKKPLKPWWENEHGSEAIVRVPESQGQSAAAEN